MIQIGDTLPDVLGLDQEGREVRMANWIGRKLVLYFYPKDNTPGCTAEACSLRDHYDELRQQGYEVIGCSADSAASHQKFIAKHNLPFNLITDPSHQLMEALGVWGEKKLAGRTYMGILRTTFVTDEQGRITHIIGPKQIKTKTHGEQLLAL